jgi:hypothetical protein
MASEDHGVQREKVQAQIPDSTLNRSANLTIAATDEEPFRSLPTVPPARHQISGQRRPTHKRSP